MNHNYETCPIHKVKGTHVPPPKKDKSRRKLIWTFKCPEGHNFKKEFDLK